MPQCLLITRLEIKNPSATERLAFKLKTNNPASYKVQPTQGIVAEKQSMFIEIQLLPIPLKDGQGQSSTKIEYFSSHKF